MASLAEPDICRFPGHLGFVGNCTEPSGVAFRDRCFPILADTLFTSIISAGVNQPPVSVMGINVLEKVSDQDYLVGSFSGMFVWNPSTRMVYDAFTGQPPQVQSTRGNPLGENMVSGFIQSGKGPIWFDYNHGVVSSVGSPVFPDMPMSITEESPMSLWNLALEIHTARFFKVIFGDFYILLIPLIGIFGLVILITGILVWAKLAIRKRRSHIKCTEKSAKNSLGEKDYVTL